MKFPILSIISILFTWISSTTSLVCHYCNDFALSKVPCRDGLGDFNIHTCRPEVYRCFSGVFMFKKALIVARGCADDATPGWLECLAGYTCFTCQTEKCNINPLARPHDQHCVSCDSEADCDTKEDFAICGDGGKLPINTPQYCFSKYRLKPTPAIVEKGCGFGEFPTKEFVYIPCTGQVCNSIGNKRTHLICYRFQGQSKDYMAQRVVTPCGVGQRLFNNCFQDIRKGIVTQGCANIDQFPQIAYDKMQTCDGELCNGKLSKLFINVCATGSGPRDLQECRQLFSLCFISRRIPMGSAITNNNTIKGGCTEIFRHKKEVHLQYAYQLGDQETHFCSNHETDLLPCNSFALDYTKRISCFRCVNCDDVWLRDYEVRRLCPERTRYCFVTFDTYGRVRRGCDHGTDLSVNICKALPHSCITCNTNYCNHFGITKIRAKCYKTRPYQNEQHMMTMRLEDCMGMSFTDNGPACYMAESADEPFVRAGCLNEVDVDLINYKTVYKGDLSIVRHTSLECFKCNSTDQNYCYRIRFMEPEKCKGHARYAIRGCYMIVEKDRIERGCLTELSVYKQKLCTMRHFEEYCRMCRYDGCNGIWV